MRVTSDKNYDLTILEEIEEDPDATQASLAVKVGVAIGTINWHLKRLVEKGYVEVQRARRRKLRYFITPEGEMFRSRLMMDYIQNSFELYRQVRKQAVDVLADIQKAGYDHVRLCGNGDVADVCRLTCQEQSITIDQDGKTIPIIEIQDLRLSINWNENQERSR